MNKMRIKEGLASVDTSMLPFVHDWIRVATKLIAEHGQTVEISFEQNQYGNTICTVFKYRDETDQEQAAQLEDAV